MAVLNLHKAWLDMKYLDQKLLPRTFNSWDSVPLKINSVCLRVTYGAGKTGNRVIFSNLVVEAGKEEPFHFTIFFPGTFIDKSAISRI